MKTIFSWGEFHCVRDDFKVANINSTGCVLSTAPDKIKYTSAIRNIEDGIILYVDTLSSRMIRTE